MFARSQARLLSFIIVAVFIYFYLLPCGFFRRSLSLFRQGFWQLHPKTSEKNSSSLRSEPSNIESPVRKEKKKRHRESSSAAQPLFSSGCSTAGLFFIVMQRTCSDTKRWFAPFLPLWHLITRRSSESNRKMIIRQGEFLICTSLYSNK